jgi:hypothetical protein
MTGDGVALALMDSLVRLVTEQRERRQREVRAGEDLYLEVSRNLMVLQALQLDEPSSTAPAFLKAASCLRFEAHEEFVKSAIARDVLVSVTPSTSPRAPSTAPNATLEEPSLRVDETTLADDWFGSEPGGSTATSVVRRAVGLTQGVAYVVAQLSALQSIATHYDDAAPALRDLRGAQRLRNVRSVENALRIHFEKHMPFLRPIAGVVALPV